MQLYNTLTRRLEELPAAPGPIRMYFCGPTVYQRAHIGNARPFVLGMWLRAWLRERGYEATLVHNITDVNDKIYEAAPGASAALAEQATQWYLEDTGSLGLGMPDELPRATAYIPQIVHFIEELIARGAAYEAGGDVYFSVATSPSYGELSRQKVDAMEPEESNALKRAPQDFALWKATKPGEDTSWESPWGMGRPGWHIECSVMAEEAFGPVFEIHGGGLDLVFPHHENELAQSKALGHDFAHIWTHNGLLTSGGEKMSKSLGNDTTIQGVVERWGRETALMLFLRGHWRKPLDFNETTLAQAKAEVEGFRNVFRGEQAAVGDWADFEAALDDDFNTPEALAVLHGWRDHALLQRALALFGLDSLAARAEAPAEVVALAEQRKAARAAKDFAESDRLRDEIGALGWDVRDVAGGYELVPHA
ncbi:MAG: cysteine--tRNA ligase [Actinomycetota bacterium]